MKNAIKKFRKHCLGSRVARVDGIQSTARRIAEFDKLHGVVMDAVRPAGFVFIVAKPVQPRLLWHIAQLYIKSVRVLRKPAELHALHVAQNSGPRSV